MSQGTRILIVDDDDDFRRLLREVLEQEGCSVLDAENGEVALRVLRANQLLQLIITDLQMPVMNGWRFNAELQKDPALATIPVAVLSAVMFGVPPMRLVGAAWELRKPIDLSALLCVLRSLQVPAQPTSVVRLRWKDSGEHQSPAPTAPGTAGSPVPGRATVMVAGKTQRKA